jgi:hypothetical protein
VFAEDGPQQDGLRFGAVTDHLSSRPAEGKFRREIDQDRGVERRRGLVSESPGEPSLDPARQRFASEENEFRSFWISESQACARWLGAPTRRRAAGGS